MTSILVRAAGRYPTRKCGFTEGRWRVTEKQIIPSATVEDIDFGAVRAYMRAQGLDMDEGPQPAREDDLRNASVVDELDGILRPTLYGLMTFGRDP